MPSQQQPQPQPSLPTFANILYDLESLKAHLEALQKRLKLAQQQQQQHRQPQQPYQRTRGYPPGPQPAYGLPPSSPTPSPALVLSDALTPPSQAQGRGQARPAPTTSTATAMTPPPQVLAQIDVARDGVVAANAELSQAIAVLRRSVQELVGESTADLITPATNLNNIPFPPSQIPSRAKGVQRDLDPHVANAFGANAEYSTSITSNAATSPPSFAARREHEVASKNRRVMEARSDNCVVM